MGHQTGQRFVRYATRFRTASLFYLTAVAALGALSYSFIHMGAVVSFCSTDASCNGTALRSQIASLMFEASSTSVPIPMLKPVLSAPGLGAFSVRVHATTASISTHELLVRVAKGEDLGSLGLAWSKFQDGIASRLKYSAASRLRVLISSPVAKHMLQNAAAVVRKLREARAQDEFHIALFRYDEPAGQALPELDGEIGKVLNSIIVYQQGGPSCHVHQWRKLTPEFVRGYDYVWAVDGDVSMTDFFSWDIFRHYLLEFQPLAAQASVLGAPPDNQDTQGHSTHLRMLRMRGPKADGTVAAVAEVERIEMMAPLISTRYWPLVQQRMLNVSGNQPFVISGYWNRAMWHAFEQGCLDVPGIMVNLSPMRHLNYQGYTKTKSHCRKTLPRKECYPMSQEEVDRLAAIAGCPPGTATDIKSWPGRNVCGWQSHDSIKKMGLREWFISIDDDTSPIPLINFSRPRRSHLRKP